MVCKSTMRLIWEEWWANDISRNIKGVEVTGANCDVMWKSDRSVIRSDERYRRAINQSINQSIGSNVSIHQTVYCITSWAICTVCQAP